MWNPFKKEVPVLNPQAPSKNWRKGMWVWVVPEKRIAILTSIDPVCEIHYVAQETGETTLITQTSINSLRQATWLEIPPSRRGDQERARELGYGS